MGLQGEIAAKDMDGTGARRPWRGWLPGSYEVHLRGTRPGRGSRGCWTAIDRQMHGVLSWWDCGGRSGRANRVRSSRTFLECGNVVITAVAAMGGRGQTTGWDWLIVHAPGAGGFSDICERRKYGEALKWGTSGGWWGIIDGRDCISNSFNTGRFCWLRRQVRPCTSGRG